LKILLVEFPNVRHNTSPSYTYDNFNNLFFSTNVYVSPNMYSPDGEPVSGSMRDYYSIMSDGEFNLTGYVVNPDENENGIPDWLMLPLRKGQYDSLSFWTFITDAYNAANAAGIDVSTDGTTKLAIIYAGHTYRTYPTFGGLNPRSDGYDWYTMGEKFAAGTPGNAERPDAKFSEIGINVHEFAHLLGIPDLYDNGHWDIMNGGPYLVLAEKVPC
jgi:M6 family metalloprotease-like protein